MTSLLRDMYVDIPGRDGNRLNAAYSFGGPELLLETVKQNLGIEVNRYAVVNFQAFANLVDAVNGVDLELTNEEVKWVNAYLNEYNELRGMPMETDYLDTSLSAVSYTHLYDSTNQQKNDWNYNEAEAILSGNYIPEGYKLMDKFLEIKHKNHL